MIFIFLEYLNFSFFVGALHFINVLFNIDTDSMLLTILNELILNLKSIHFFMERVHYLSLC